MNAPVVLLGHVDHGKSAVFKAFGGATFRENERGNTIDFSVAEVAGVTLLDVPGHRDYRANTFAAISGAGGFALVVSAEDGVSRQTHDHLGFALAAGKTRGVLLWTKTDKVSPEFFAAVRSQTRLPSMAEVVLGDARQPTPAKVAELREAIHRVAASGDSAPDDERSWLWVDRTFLSKSSGRIVTGTWQGNQAARPGTVLWSDGKTSWRVRALEQHGTAVDVATHGQRVALALALAGDGELHRGSRLVTLAALQASRRVDVQWVTEAPVRTGSSCEVWSGPGHQLATVEGFRDGLARLRLAKPVPWAVGDRLVLRDGGGEHTLGHAFVLDPSPNESFRFAPGIQDGFLDRRTVVTAAQWWAHTLRKDPPPVSRSEMRWQWALEAARRAIENAEKPVTGRMLRREPAVLRLGKRHYESFLESLAAVPEIYRGGGRWWSPRLLEAPWGKQASELERRIEEGRWTLAGATRAERETLQWLLSTERVIAFDEETFWSRARYAKESTRVHQAFHAAPADGLTLNQLRERLGLSRREAVWFFEGFDRRGVTERRGDKRVLTSSCRDRLRDSVPPAPRATCDATLEADRDSGESASAPRSDSASSPPGAEASPRLAKFLGHD